MALQDELKRNRSLKLHNGVFYQADLPKQNDFELMYLSLRSKENRLYTDEIVKTLPKIPHNHVLEREWRVRSISSEKLISYLKRSLSCAKILEVGCGNGWLASKIASELSADILAMDVNEAELLQGARVFPSEQLSFLYGDIRGLNLKDIYFDCIVLASSVQYFPDLVALIKRLIKLLTPSGQIHIIDSPIYSSNEAIVAARERSLRHFTSLGHPDLARFYFHHAKELIGIFNYTILEDPNSIVSIIKRQIFRSPHPVFPWIMIKAD
jgi:ubiquinone/menaquinone biosynthesis C-methylase UbiE